MKREVKRERTLPAFSMGIGELEVLCKRLTEQFENPEDVYISIDITLPSESLEFKGVEELKQYSALRGRITKFRLWFSQGGRHVSIWSSSFFGSLPEVGATAETEAWCAGAIETVNAFIQSNKLWYHWFVSAPIGWILFIFANIPSIVLLFLPQGQSLDKSVFAGWLAITISLAILYFFRARLLPSSVIVVTREESFVRRNAAELSLVVAIASAVLTVVGWFVGK
ncbi:hypothetical protein ACK33C_08900 [Aeromonas hydrophila]|uniref:hypothetical protein n=1 Tax=Aeromonas hydrophila TaxID=644 RepID=UPI00398770B8